MANLGSTDVLGAGGACTVTRCACRNDARCTNYGPGGKNLYGGISVSLWEIANSFLGIANDDF